MRAGHRRRRGGAAPPVRSAVSATIADGTPGIAFTASSARLRTGSQACTAPASTVIEKNTLPSLTTISDSVPVSGSAVPSGRRHLPQRRQHLSLVTAITHVLCAVVTRHHTRNCGPARYSCKQIAEETMAKVAFLGLGVMGYPMAGHLKNKGGHEVTVYNRTAAKADKWVAQYGGKSARDAEGSRHRPGLRDVLRRQRQRPARSHARQRRRLRTAMGKGAVFVDHTTASAEIARELHAEAKKRGFEFVDAPVSGGQAGAENGVLTVMCGGERRPVRQRREGDRGLCARLAI